MEAVLMHHTRHCSSAGVEAKVTDSDTNGEITGYGAIWDVRDLDGDIIRKGSFRQSIGNQVAQGRVLIMVKHFRDGGDTMEAVGQIVEAREDDIGLFVRAKIYGTQTAQDIRRQIQSSPNAYGMSVGWRDIPNGKRPLPDGYGYEYLAMNLKEVTLTLMPAQEQTLGTVRGKNALEAIAEQLSRFNERLDALEANKATKPEVVEEETVDGGKAEGVSYRHRPDAEKARRRSPCRGPQHGARASGLVVERPRRRAR
jgi:HK97 family phage prohead protease